MDRVKTFAKYVLIVIGIYIFSTVCIYVGLNSTYKNIQFMEELPNGVTIRLAQSTKVNGRIYGEVTSTEQNNLEGKYIKVEIYNKRGNLVGEKYLKITGTKLNEPKKFSVNFTADNINSYTVQILDDTEENSKQYNFALDKYKDIFTDEELKGFRIILLVLGLTFIL